MPLLNPTPRICVCVVLWGCLLTAILAPGKPLSAGEDSPVTPCPLLENPDHPEFDAETLRPIPLHPNVEYPWLDVHINQLSSDYTQAETAKTEAARRIMEVVLNSEELKEQILRFTWNGKPAFLENQGKTNEQVYATLRTAVEGLYANEPHKAEFNHRLYSKFWPSKEVGYSSYGNPWINTNRRFYRNYTVSEIAGHLTHEWTHLLGFTHRSTFRGTVPYEVGYLVSRLGR